MGLLVVTANELVAPPMKPYTVAHVAVKEPCALCELVFHMSVTHLLDTNEDELNMGLAIVDPVLQDA